jgi:Domain of unknown function (DUF4335)
MTIQRQYSLPNCTLLLEGLSDATTGNAQEVRPVMSILVNAECHLAGGVPSLSGGRDFFEGLVKAVSRYAQEFLSGIPHPPEDGQALSLVKLQPVERNLHRLVVHNQADVVLSNGATTNGKPNHPIQIDLTTVQLCDLVEAVDQFFADTQTLPELSLQLTPVERRYARTDEPVAKRAIPPAVGVSSLALAAIAFFFVPVPQRPVEPQPQSDSSTTSTTATETTPTTPGASPSPIPIDPTATPSPTNLPPSSNALISPGASPTESPTTEAQISPSPTESPATEAQISPSPTESPTTEAQISPSPTESPTTEAQISPSPTESPATEAQVSPSPTPTELTQTYPSPESTPSATETSSELQITDRRQLRQLNRQLYEKIEQNRGEEPLRFPSRLEYRVGVRADGTVVSYEGKNRAAIDNASQTPLAKIKSENTSVPSQEPIAYYRVIFTRRGVLQVSPW